MSVITGFLAKNKLLLFGGDKILGYMVSFSALIARTLILFVTQ